MATLKRPPEKHWNWRQPPDPFPSTPGCSGAFVAKTASGKTTTLISMVLGPYRKVFDSIFVVSPSINIDSAWDPVKDFAKGLKSADFLEDFDENRIIEILDGQRQKIHELKTSKSKKPLPQCLFILDDVSDRPEILHSQRAGSILSTMFTRGRHIGISCWLSVQKLTTISTVARVNFRFMCVWRQMNQRELMSILEELSAVYPINILYEMYETAVYDKDYSFWFIDFTKKKKQDMFYIRFDEKLAYE